MTISNTQAVKLALIPGAAETLENAAISSGNLAWDGMAKTVKYARNTLYVGVALTAIGATIAALSGEDNTTRQYAGATVGAIGTSIATFAAKKLWDATSLVQTTYNSGGRL
jgi:hypothetical protein